jgi:hypothetical protein
LNAHRGHQAQGDEFEKRAEFRFQSRHIARRSSPTATSVRRGKRSRSRASDR